MPELDEEESDLGKFQNSNLCTITYEQVRTAMKGQAYPMQLARGDAEMVQQAVNQGIDSRLEACFCPERGDRYDWQGGKLDCEVSPESLPVLLRRLFEDALDDEEGEGASLAECILETLGFDDCGKFTPKED